MNVNIIDYLVTDNPVQKSSKFGDIPANEDAIITEHLIEIKHLNGVYQEWLWNGITGKSLVFLTNDVFDKTDAELKNILEDCKSLVTVKRGDKYTFINFDFNFD